MGRAGEKERVRSPDTEYWIFLIGKLGNENFAEKKREEKRKEARKEERSAQKKE